MSVLPDEYISEIHDEAIPEIGGSNAWAAWNSCQGIFTCSVRHTRKEVEEIFDQYKDAGCRIVPVRVFVEREDNWFYRDCDENDWEKVRAS